MEWAVEKDCVREELGSSQGSSETSSLVRGLGMGHIHGEKEGLRPRWNHKLGGMQCVHSHVTGLCGLAHGWQANDS